VHAGYSENLLTIFFQTPGLTVSNFFRPIAS
jgi:hypothetical protein